MVDTLEKLAPYVTREWLHERRIVIFTSTDTSNGSIDAWANSIIEVARNWQPTPARPYLAMYDISKAVITPYSRKRAQEAALAFPTGTWGYSAIILPKSPIGFMMRLFANRDLTTENFGVQRGFFQSREEGLKWLVSKLDETREAEALTATPS